MPDFDFYVSMWAGILLVSVTCTSVVMALRAARLFFNDNDVRVIKQIVDVNIIAFLISFISFLLIITFFILTSFYIILKIFFNNLADVSFIAILSGEVFTVVIGFILLYLSLYFGTTSLKE